MTGRAGHRQQRCVLMSAEIAGIASKWRTQRRSRGEQRDHGTAGIARRPEPRLSFTQDVRIGRVSGKCRFKCFVVMGMIFMRICVVKILAVLSTVALGTRPAIAAHFQLIHSFQSDVGRTPIGALTNLGGILYGTTSSGGATNTGTIFSVDPSMDTEALLFTFDGTNGADSDGAMIAIEGTLFGATGFGGGHPNNCGADGEDTCGNVFAFNPLTGAEGQVYGFQGGNDGSAPSGLLNIGGTIYGTTANGGGAASCAVGCGSVFALNLRTRVEQTLYSFQGGADGEYPSGKLIEVGGLLYGTTYMGGNAQNCDSGCGTVFSIDPTTGSKKTLYIFQGGSDAARPSAGLLDIGGTLFGTTSEGGGGYDLGGTVFSLSLTTGAEKVVYAFKGGRGDGSSPLCDLIEVDGKLIGTTNLGGIGSAHFGDGTIFSVDPETGAESILHFFRGGNNDGEGPDAGVIKFGRSLYGTTLRGGSDSSGTVYSLSP
jgi:uncharacterized repeat protein (TIGR03803 family)